MALCSMIMNKNGGKRSTNELQIQLHTQKKIAEQFVKGHKIDQDM